jgi:sarcosine oxidase, subunit gamma
VIVDALLIANLSAESRVGFKGHGTLPAMKTRNFVFDDAPNRVYRQPDRVLCLVLGKGEVLLLGPVCGEKSRLKELEATWRIEDQEYTYPVPRADSHAWFAIRGSAAPAMFAKLCGVDLTVTKFPNMSIAQTSVARVNSIVFRDGPVLHLLADSASANYMKACLVDAAAEFGGKWATVEEIVSSDSGTQ